MSYHRGQPVCVYFSQCFNPLHPPFLLAGTDPVLHLTADWFALTPPGGGWGGCAYTSKHLGAHSCGNEIAPRWNTSVCLDFGRAEA